MSRRYPIQEKEGIFDGFCHRGFDPAIDGWRNEMPDVEDYPAVQQARDVLAMFEEISELRRQVWALEKQLSAWRGK